MAEKYTGLTEEEVRRRTAAGQVNTTDTGISRTTSEICRTHIFTVFNFLNVVLAVLVVMTGQLRNLAFLLTAVANTAIGIIQEMRVKQQIDQLSVITASKAKVIRDGKRREIPLDQIVLGDIMILESGDQVGSDCRILESSGVEANESMITGESVSIRKNNGDSLYSGSFLSAGSCVAEVVNIGKDNYATILAAKAKNKKRASSEMQNAIGKIIRVVGFLIVPVGIMLYISQTSVPGTSWGDAVNNTVAGVIGMIPEGLVLLTSVSFIAGVGKLAMKGALVQEMESIEALARVNVLCTDKTGTITTGELEVIKAEPCGSMDEEEIAAAMSSLAWAFDDVNATQTALRNFYSMHTSWQAQTLIPFSSARKYRAASFKDHGSFVLGAPEFILEKDDPVLDKVERYAGEGNRVLLLASCSALSEQDGSITGPQPQALIVISDCVREDAADTFAFFDSQHVAVKVISGDNPATVSNIAVKAGLKNGDKYIDARELPEDEEEMKQAVAKYTVFGRVTPEQKQRIIHAYQSAGNVVGMVGDGVNDVLALKDADCGIAMADGSDAARQVAHIVLMDSDFAHMKEIFREGSTIISNIQRVSSLYLTKTIYSVILSVLFILIGKSYPFVPIQLTLISTFAIGIPSFFLALEQTDSPIQSGFMKNVLSVAVPGAAAMVINMLLIQLMSAVFGFSTGVTATYNLIVATVVSMLVLDRVSQPLNRMRRYVINTMLVLFAISIIFFPDFFGIEKVFVWRMVFIIPFVIFTWYSMAFFEWLIHAIFRKRLK